MATSKEMFSIREEDLPVIRTRQALVVLDFQNDLVSEEGVLPVREPQGYADRIISLTSHFRPAGKVIWVRSHFEGHRPVNDDSRDSEQVITDDQCSSSDSSDEDSGELKLLPDTTAHNDAPRTMPERPLTDHAQVNGEEKGKDILPEGVYETYLTIIDGQRPKLMLPMTAGANPVQILFSNFDANNDLIFTKSHYSALKTGHLLLALRGALVTELYICGALTNISIYATAMDAARYGYKIVLVEDCMGYRSKKRNDEAIRRLVETTGCEVMTSAQVILRKNKEKDINDKRSAATVASRNGRDGRSLSSMLDNMRNRPENLPYSPLPSRIQKSNVQSRKSKETIPAPGMEVGELEGGDASTSSNGIIRPDSKLLVSDDMPIRVPSKTRIRRKPSTKSRDLAEASTATNGAASTHGKARPASPTRTRLTGASDLLERMSQMQLKDATSDKIATEAAGKGMALRNENLEIDGGIPKAREKASKPRRDSKQRISGRASNRSSPKPALEIDPYRAKLGPTICEGDTLVINDLLPKPDGFFEEVRGEVQWQRMSHLGGEVPRLVAVQGQSVSDGSIPVYRHPSDESPPLLPFSPAVLAIKVEVEKYLGHQVNHCLIQFYRDGSDYISEHSDKTLDIARNSFIANVSLGAMRTMTFRTKKTSASSKSDVTSEVRQSVKALLPHNSMCKLGFETNKKWLHSIRQDKRRVQEKTVDELAYGGERISLTFRLIKTFLSKDQSKIWGQGATSKSFSEAQTVLNGSEHDSELMIRAFGAENRSDDFDWDSTYGDGFDVLHVSNPRKLFLSGDPTVDLKILIILAEYNVSWIPGKPTETWSWVRDKWIKTLEPPADHMDLRLVDNDYARSTIEGDMAVTIWVEAFWGPGEAREELSKTRLGKTLTRMHQAKQLMMLWRQEQFDVRKVRKLIAMWNGYASEDVMISGCRVSMADWSIWPVLHDIIEEWGLEGLQAPNLAYYYQMFKARTAVRAVLDAIKAKAKEKDADTNFDREATKALQVDGEKINDQNLELDVDTFSGEKSKGKGEELKVDLESELPIEVDDEEGDADSDQLSKLGKQLLEQVGQRYKKAHKARPQIVEKPKSKSPEPGNTKVASGGDKGSGRLVQEGRDGQNR